MRRPPALPLEDSYSLLGAAFVEGLLHRSVLEECVDLNPSTLILRGDDVSGHGCRAETLLEGSPAFRRRTAHGVEDGRLSPLLQLPGDRPYAAKTRSYAAAVRLPEGRTAGVAFAAVNYRTS